jgi:uncharacterized membrane-anchored protein
MRSKEKLLKQKAMAWVENFSQMQIRIIGALETISAAVIFAHVVWLLSYAKNLPIFMLISWVAANLVLFVLMCGAACTHMRRREYGVLPLNIVLGLLALYLPVLIYGLSKVTT